MKSRNTLVDAVSDYPCVSEYMVKKEREIEELKKKKDCECGWQAAYDWEKKYNSANKELDDVKKCLKQIVDILTPLVEHDKLDPVTATKIADAMQELATAREGKKLFE